MLTKSDFSQAIADTIESYPAVAPFYHANDPRIMQHLQAMATMLAMFSAQIETAMAEPFEKARNATVLADASMKGIVKKARPGVVRITLTNTSTTPYTLATSRNILDSSGNIYRIDTPATVDPSATVTFEARQVKQEIITHTVANSIPFYAIEIPESDNDGYLSGIAVSDEEGEYEYRERYVNTAVDERVFHVESDDRQRVYVRFGQSGIVGFQPENGRVITLTINRSVGAIAPEAGSPFALEYVYTPQESELEFSLDAVLDSGSNPPDMAVLRDFAKYPSVYNHNAVYLGNFDFLVRRNYPDLRFLSIWNEAYEELVRGPSLDNINCIFVACLSETGDESVLTEPDPEDPVAAVEIETESLTETQDGIMRAILNADDSYNVRFFTPVRSKIAVTVSAIVAASYDTTQVKQQIEEVILQEYGETAPASKRGRNKPLHQRIYFLLRQKVRALSAGSADFTLHIQDPASPNVRPELWRYVAEDSLSVTVTGKNVITPNWGG